MDKWLKTGSILGDSKLPKPSVRQSSCNAADAPDTAKLDQGEIEVQPPPALPPPVKKSKRAETSSTTSKVRKYDASYLQWGFTWVGDEKVPDGLCVVCQTVLKNSSLAPAKLQRHFKASHEALSKKPMSYFERLASELAALQKKLRFKDDLHKPNEASFRLSYLIARAGEAHTIGETLVKPCIIEAAQCLFSSKEVKAVKSIPLADNTVGRRISDISSSLEQKILDQLKVTPFWALQLDESTDVAGLAVLLVFVRYVFDNSVHEEMLICKPLPLHTTGEAIFELVNEYVSFHNILWDKCIDVCTDGAAAMVGRQKGFVARVRQVAKNATYSHCILHRESLVAKRITPTLKAVLDEAVKVVNFIKTRPLSTRIFKALCEEMGATHVTLLLHTEVRWLSRGRVLLRLFELRSEVLLFSVDHHFELFARFQDEVWLQRLAYLADIFGKLNDLNLCLQGRQTNIFTAREKIVATKRKIELWTARVSEKRIDMLTTLDEFLQENSFPLDDEVQNEIIRHLKDLRDSFEKYFPSEGMRCSDSEDAWIRNPFSDNATSTLEVKQAEELIEVCSSAGLKDRFGTLPLVEFWAGIQNEFPGLSRLALKKLLPFVTTYYCETGFSTYSATKTKYRNRLNAEPDMRIQLTEIEPDFAALTKDFQFQVSH